MSQLAGPRVLLVESNEMNQNPGNATTVGAGSAPSGADALPDLPGIDKAAGLATTMGNAKLYTRLLIKFRDGHANFAELFAAAQSGADPTAAMRCAHTLKGTAGNIGARGVQAAAGRLEHASNQNAPAVTIQALLGVTLAELSPVIAALASVGADEAEPAGPSGALDMVKVKALLERLARQLADADAEAADTLEKLQTLAQGTSLAGALQKVAAAMDEYDFDAALEHLKTIEQPA